MKGDGIPLTPVSGPLLPPRKDFLDEVLGRLGHVARVVRGPAEDVAQAGFEGGQGLGGIVGIEGALVPVGTEGFAGLVPGVAEKLVAGISIAAAVMRVVVRLKQS